MPLLNSTNEVRKILKYYSEKRVSIPCFCAENTYTMEGVLMGASDFAIKNKLNSVAVYIAATGNYHGRQQLKNYTSLDRTEEGFMAFRNDLERLARVNGPFNNVQVIPSLDHGQPKLDEFLFEEGRGFWGCVMYDCSTRPLDENRRMTADFVIKHRDDYVIEGCVDEINESGTGGMNLTGPENAKRFLEETGVDLVVVNVGTEHRATKADIRYRSDIAKKIYELVGYKLVLHGTSSLSQQDLCNLRHDGIAKVNIWTVLETRGAQLLLRNMIENIGRIIPDDYAKDMFEKGLIGKAAFDNAAKYQQQLGYMVEVYRRNEIKVPVIKELIEKFLEAFYFSIKD
ncbi:MAG: class II fructose-bisphosphate aldolase [Phycisphaerales bacterium]